METVKAEYEDLPCGIVCIAGSKRPKINYINGRMHLFMGEGERTVKWISFIKENMLLAIPVSERDQFIHYLERAAISDAPFKVRHKIIDINEKEKKFIGWMQGVTLENGEREIRVVYSPPDQPDDQPTRHEVVFYEVLKKYYDVIFEVDLENRIVDCKFSKPVKHYGLMPVVRYTYDGAFDYLIPSYIYEEDREMVTRFRNEVFENVSGFDADVKSIRFRVKHREYPIILMDCDVLGIDDKRCLVGFKNILDEAGDEPASKAKEGGKPKVTIRNGESFDVFVDGKPIAFRNEKAKELLQIMVAKNGAYVGATHAIKLLWPGEESTKTVQSRYRQIALRLNNTLKEYGILDIIENKAGQRRIIPEKVLIES